jgi:hypothetical protein
MEYCLDYPFNKIEDKLGKFILTDDSYKICNGHSIARILVEIDIIQGLFDSMDLIMRNLSHTQLPDYINFPFNYPQCHHYGNFKRM